MPFIDLFVNSSSHMSNAIEVPAIWRLNAASVVKRGCPGRVAQICHDAQSHLGCGEGAGKVGVTQGSPLISLRQLAADLGAAVLFFTRLPLPGAPTISGADIARAGWAFPIAGAIVGLIAAVVYWLARAAGLPPFPSAGLTVAATLVVTGCLHEDGLADVADSFGAATRERKLEIMRDSKIGTYGVCALFVSLLLRSGALATIADPALAAPVLVAAHMAGRASMPLFMRLVPPARADGLSVSVGRPPRASAIAAALIGIVALGVALGPAATVCAIALLAAGFGSLAWLCVRQIGGQTGDVLGALEQIGEIVILLVAAANIGA
jgi:adenosylcobinamide-GDP ribazoletransferase